MPATKLLSRQIGLLFFIALLSGCAQHTFRADYKTANALLHDSANLRKNPFLKAHLKDGCVYIFDDHWAIDTLTGKVSGKGSYYDADRTLVRSGLLQVSLDSIGLLETNVKLNELASGRVLAITLIVIGDVALGVFCIAQPKACFGSCPTFYTGTKGYWHYADAEGFSNAICPAMEYGDIDALGSFNCPGDTFGITMKNEALETHCIRTLRLLACPVGGDERIYQTPQDSFYRCKGIVPLTKATGPEGDITQQLLKCDIQERFSLADKNNLCSKEELHLTFDHVPDGDGGLILHFRQTLMTTYFIYSALGYMGDRMGDYVNRMPAKMPKIQKVLGNIEVYAWDDRHHRWVHENAINETGPIAINKQMVPLTHIHPVKGRIRIKLVLNQGLWRLDYAALTNILSEAHPVTLNPVAAAYKGKADPKALYVLNDTAQHLVTLPGDAYRFTWHLPVANKQYDLFLYSKGYYLEWGREHWIKEKNIARLSEMLVRPKAYLRSEAKAYKTYEDSMERQFWGSKIETNEFSYEK